MEKNLAEELIFLRRSPLPDCWIKLKLRLFVSQAAVVKTKLRCPEQEIGQFQCHSTVFYNNH